MTYLAMVYLPTFYALLPVPDYLDTPMPRVAMWLINLLVNNEEVTVLNNSFNLTFTNPVVVSCLATSTV